MVLPGMYYKRNTSSQSANEFSYYEYKGASHQNYEWIGII